MTKKKKKDITGANIVKDEEGTQYHIGLAKGELAENIVLVGDPARPDRVKKLFPFPKREEELLRVINSLVTRKKHP